MKLTKRLCRRYHATKHWQMLPQKSRKIPYKTYFAFFLCQECGTVRTIEYPYCSTCQSYMIPSHDHLLSPLQQIEPARSGKRGYVIRGQFIEVHEFEGIISGTPDRDCTRCGMPDRDIIHLVYFKTEGN